MASPTIASSLRHRTNQGLLAGCAAAMKFSYLVTLACAALIFVRVALIVEELWVNSQPAMKGIRLGLPADIELGSKWRQVWRAAVYLRYLRDLRARATHCGAAGVASAIFLAEMAPPNCRNVLTFLIELWRRSPA